jgi:hypothetical protein
MESVKNNTTGEDCVEERDCIEESDCGSGGAAVKVEVAEEEEDEIAAMTRRILCLSAALARAEAAKKKKEDATFLQKIQREGRAMSRWENLRISLQKYHKFMYKEFRNYFWDDHTDTKMRAYETISMGRRPNREELKHILSVLSRDSTDDYFARLDSLLETFAARELKLMMRAKKLLRSLDGAEDGGRSSDSDYGESDDDDSEDESDGDKPKEETEEAKDSE